MESGFESLGVVGRLTGLITAGPVFIGAVLAGGLIGQASAVTLYDPGAGTLPSAQGWTTSGVGTFTQSVVGGAYVLDTTAAVAAGSALAAPTALDTSAGFTLDFHLHIDSETHAADNQRAGFSVIVTGADPTHSVEIGFWQTGVFAYTAAFVPGTLGPINTGALIDYSLVVGGGQYSLFGNGATLLSGSLVDYTSRGSPYTLASGLFFGDDTSRASSVSEMGGVTLVSGGLVSSVPEPASVAMMTIGLAALFAVSRPRRRSAGGHTVEGGGPATRLA